MSPEDLQITLSKKPFVPFTIHLSDGRTFRVRHPDMVFVMYRTAHIGIYEPTSGTVPDRSETISLAHITSLAPDPQPA